MKQSPPLRHLLFAVALLSTVVVVGLGPARAQTARDREEKKQSKPKKEEEKKDSGSTTVVVVHDDSGYSSSGSSSVTVPIYTGPVYPHGIQPRIAFISDRSGSPEVYIVWETGAGIRRLSKTDGGVAQDVTFSP